MLTFWLRQLTNLPDNVDCSLMTGNHRQRLTVDAAFRKYLVEDIVMVEHIPSESQPEKKAK